MHKLKQILLTLSPMMLMAGAAWATGSGLPIDTGINTWGTFLSTSAAYGLTGVGFAGVATHCVLGRDFVMGLNHSVGCLIGGGLLSQLTPAATALGLSGGALIHLH